MQIVHGAFFGNITPTSDPKRGRSFFRYQVGSLRSREVFFDGAAGDELEAVQTVKAHLTMLAAGRGRKRTESTSA